MNSDSTPETESLQSCSIKLHSRTLTVKYAAQVVRKHSTVKYAVTQGVKSTVG